MIDLSCKFESCTETPMILLMSTHLVVELCNRFMVVPRKVMGLASASLFEVELQVELEVFY